MSESSSASGSRQEASDEGAVRFEVRGATAYITFDRPHARNAMTWAMYEQLREAIIELEKAEDVRVTVLRAEGDKAFIAGTDISQFGEFQSGQDGLDYETRMESITERLEALPMPTIAAVKGYAVGGGLMLSAVCDLRICTPNVRFGMPVARTLGNCLSMANYARLVSLLGAARTKALVMRASWLEAEEALSSGFATEIVEPEELDDHVNELAAKLETHAPLTMSVTKESVRRLMLSNLPDDEDLVQKVYGSADFKEGVSAFMEKRQPQWQNR